MVRSPQDCSWLRHETMLVLAPSCDAVLIERLSACVAAQRKKYLALLSSEKEGLFEGSGFRVIELPAKCSRNGCPARTIPRSVDLKFCLALQPHSCPTAL